MLKIAFKLPLYYLSGKNNKQYVIIPIVTVLGPWAKQNFLVAVFDLYYDENTFFIKFRKRHDLDHEG